MLSTEELKNYICSEIKNKLGYIACSKVFFEEGYDNSEEGTYIFTKDNKYHILFTERGKIRSHNIMYNERNVLYQAVEEILFGEILELASEKSKEKNIPFREAYFEIKKEIFSLFGKDFEERKRKEIEELLKEYPY